LPFQLVHAGAAFLDLPKPNHYGPRGFKGRREFPGFARSAAVSRTGPVTMAGDTRDEGKNGNRSAEEAALSARLKRLGERLDRKRPSQKPEAASGTRSQASDFARGLRLSTELVAGVLVGAVIGWSLDRWLGISPWGLIIFLFLGFAAGVLNVVRSTGAAKSE
jgi:ATP synthase protein I